MKIGIVTTSFPRWPGDYMGSFVFEAARALQRMGHQVKVVTIHSPGARTHEDWNGIDIFRCRYLPEKWEMLKSLGGGIPEVWKNKPEVRIQIIPLVISHFLCALIHTRDCGFIHANWTLSAAVAWVINRLTNKPYVVTVQGSDIFKAASLPFVSWVTKLALRKAKRVIALSTALAEGVQSLDISPSQIEVIPNGVDVHQFVSLDFENRENIILFTGSLVHRKGVEYLIRAFADLSFEFPDTKLVIIGEGPQRKEYETLSGFLGVEDKIIFLGSQTPAQVAHWMQRARLFTLPSIEEGLGVVLLEALSSGTPIVATKVGGIPDVVVEEVGELVPPADSNALRQAIARFLQMGYSEWNKFNRNARLRAVEIYDWDTVVKRVDRVYRE